jgi:methylmalonyl-CoA mutase
MGLFEDFEKVSHKDWLDKITIDLKGKDFNDTLVWKSDEGISIQPFYNSNPATSSPLKQNNQWEIREDIVIDSIKKANQKALLALKGGANSILFTGEIKSQTEMDGLLKDIQTDIIELHFYNSNPKKTAQFISLENGSISTDYLAKDKAKLDQLMELTSKSSKLKTITIKSTDSTSIIQELAFGLNQAVEYFHLLTDKGIEAKIIASKIQFTFKIGTNYFFEIAKIRAARKLWQLILEQYKVKSTSMVIHSETSLEQNSDKDKNYDILRNTTKAMSAIIGGCDSLSVNPHDNTENTVAFSNRIARNIQHILKEEAFFDKVNNPADGAYYIEQLTEEISNKAWNLFQEIETKGGFLSCIENEYIKNKITC